jgi:hypothetical protein
MDNGIHIPHRKWNHPEDTLITAHQSYYWVDNVLVLNKLRVIDTLSVEQFFKKYEDFREDDSNLLTSINNLVNNFDPSTVSNGGYASKTLKSLLFTLNIREDDDYIADTLTGITAKIIEDEMIIYPIDIEKALFCYYKKRYLNSNEFD